MTEEYDDLITQLENTGLLASGPAPYVEGPTDCKIAIVGEAPGAQEEKYQKPFHYTGSSGELLNEILRSTGILRDLCYVDNVFQFRPYENHIAPYISFGRTKIKESDEFKQARLELMTRLKATSANVIVPLGNVAMYAVLGMTSITKRRGSIYWSEELQKKVIPTIHPSAALRQYHVRNFIKNDFVRIKEESKYPEHEPLKREFLLDPSHQESCEYIESLNDIEMIAFDIEVSSEEVSHISFAKAPDDAICIPFYEGGKDYFTSSDEAYIWKLISQVLSNSKVIKVAQNGVFDATFLNQKYGIRTAPLEDTMVAGGILFPDYPKGLDFLTSIYCHGEPYYKDEGKKWFKNPFADYLTFRNYSAMDSAVLLQIFPQQVEELKKLGNYETYIHQVSLIAPLTFMQVVGIRMDVAGLKKASFDTAVELVSLEKEFKELVGYDLNISSPKQMIEYFYEIKKFPKYRKSIKDPKTGQRKSVVTIDEKALKKIAGKGSREARIALDVRHKSKMKGTYYDILLDSDDRLRCSFNPIGTKNGRLSSGKTIFDTGGNLQNQPPEMKKLMIADPGYIFINIDLSQAENRDVAYVANVPRMMEAFENGEDIHALTAGLIFNKRPSEISREKGSTDIGGGRFSERDVGKRANHGFNYDLGPDNFATEQEIEVREGRFIHGRYHSIYPEIKQWHLSIQEQLRSNRILTNSYGRKRYFVERWGDQLFKGAYNFIPQSTVADKINREGINFIYYNQKLFYDVMLLNQIHDSIVFEMPIEAGTFRICQVITTICKELEKPICWKEREFVIPCDVAIGYNLKDLREFKSTEFYSELDYPYTHNTIEELLNGSKV